MVRRSLIAVIIILALLVMFVGGAVVDRYILLNQTSGPARQAAASTAPRPDAPTSTAVGAPTSTPPPMDTPTQTPALVPTQTPTLVPTQVPTLTPTDTPTPFPTPAPTASPTDTATLVPTGTPPPAGTPSLTGNVVDDPVAVVRGYFDAVNGHDYARAYGYIAGASVTPTNVSRLARGYAYTSSIDLLYARAAGYRLMTVDGRAVTCVGFGIRANSTSGTSVQFGGWYGVVRTQNNWLIDMALSYSAPGQRPTIPAPHQCGGALPVVSVTQVAGANASSA